MKMRRAGYLHDSSVQALQCLGLVMDQHFTTLHECHLISAEHKLITGRKQIQMSVLAPRIICHVGIVMSASTFSCLCPIIHLLLQVVIIQNYPLIYYCFCAY